MTYGFIGTGNMGGALARAAAKAAGPANVLLYNRTMEKAERKGFYRTVYYIPVVVSMAAGVTLKALRDNAFETCPIIRIMPNTACAVGAGLVLYDGNDGVTETQLQGFLDGMAACGRMERLLENLIDAGSAVAGCGGAFACLFMEALADGAVSCGLPRDKANVYAAQMLLGAAQLALESRQPFGAMKDAICSPGGTTIAGVRALEEGGFRAAAMNAVIAAYEKTLALK